MEIVELISFKTFLEEKNKSEYLTDVEKQKISNLIQKVNLVFHLTQKNQSQGLSQHEYDILKEANKTLKKSYIPETMSA